PVSLSNGVVLGNATITLRYDAAALTLTAVRADPSSGLNVVANPSGPGQVSVTVSQPSATQVTGVLALFDFQVAGPARPVSTLALDLSAVTVNGEPLDSVPGADGTDGRVLVTPPIVMMQASSGAGIEASTTSATRAAQARLLSGEAA